MICCVKFLICRAKSYSKSKEDILKQRDSIEEDIWNNLGDIPLQ